MSLIQNQISEKENRFNNIDTLRGIAILMVVIVHSTLLSGLNAEYFNKIGSIGSFGVDLFFVISGFLITNILLRAKGTKNYFKNFYIRRALRIFPLYYGFLILYIIIIPNLFVNNPGYLKLLKDDQLFYWFYIPNILFSLYPERAQFSHLWSLAIEEQYYLIWPVVVAFINTKYLLRLLIFLLVTSFALRSYFVINNYHPLFIWSFTPIRLEAIAVGSIVAVLQNYKMKCNECIIKYNNILLCIFGLITLLLFVFNSGFYWDQPYIQTFGILVIDILFGLIVFKCINISDFKSTYLDFILKKLGKYCYAIYMFHQSILHRVTEKIKAINMQNLKYFEPYLKVVLIFAATISITYLLAIITWNLYEKHFIKLKIYFK